MAGSRKSHRRSMLLEEEHDLFDGAEPETLDGLALPRWQRRLEGDAPRLEHSSGTVISTASASMRSPPPLVCTRTLLALYSISLTARTARRVLGEAVTTRSQPPDTTTA